MLQNISWNFSELQAEVGAVLLIGHVLNESWVSTCLWLEMASMALCTAVFFDGLCELSFPEWQLLVWTIRENRDNV